MRNNDGLMSNYAQSAYYLFMKKNEVEALKSVIDDLPPNSVCVNIGAGMGISGSAFIESDTVGKLYTVDLYTDATQNTMGNLAYEKGLFDRFGFGDDPRYHQILGECTEVGRNWNYEMIDMLFLDADHTYEHTYNNIMAWARHIKRRGVISFHDYQEPEYPGVEQAVNELVAPNCELIICSPSFIAFKV